MASITYRVKGNKKEQTIYARMYFSKGIEIEASTKLNVFKADWSQPKQCVKNTKNSASYFEQTNRALRKLATFFQESINTAISNKEMITKDFLKDIIPKCFNQPKILDENNPKLYFIPFVRQFIEQAKVEIKPKTGKTVSKRTIQKYEGTLNKLIEFEKENKKPLTNNHINLTFHRNFLSFCTDYHKLKPNSTGKHIKVIKAFCRKAEAMGIQIPSDYESSNFFAPTNETNDFALTNEEVQKIEKTELPKESLKNARDWFIIGVWTGLRVDDLLNLSHSDVKKDCFFVKNRKTGIKVVIPIHESVKKILQKRDGRFPQKISSQRFNNLIKEVAKFAGITNKIKGGKIQSIKIDGKTVNRKIDDIYPKHELLTAHCCRRTFATLHYGKIDTLTIMHVTGHKTEKQFLEYVKITPTQHAEKMRKWWEESQKKDETP